MIGAALSFVSFFVAVDKESDSPVGARPEYSCLENARKYSWSENPQPQYKKHIKKPRLKTRFNQGDISVIEPIGSKQSHCV